MNKILTILFLFVFLTSFGQVKDTIYSGETFIINLGDSLSRVDEISSNTVATSKYGGTVVDEVFYVPSTAPNDTIYTLMGNRTVGKTAAILFERGSSRDTTIVVSSDSLVFGAYGTGAKPKIYGSEIITGWTLHSGNIWKATVADNVEQLFLDNEIMQLARYPKTGYFSITGVTSNTEFTSTDLDGGNDYTDAQITMRTDAYSFDITTISASSSQTLTMSAALRNGSGTYTRSVGDGFWLANKLEYLTQAGDWYHDSATNTLYFWTPDSTSPTNYEVRASIREKGIDTNGKNNLVFRDMEILHQYNYGLHTNTSDNIDINNVDFYYTGVMGIGTTNYLSDDVSVKYCDFYGSGSGVMAFGNRSIIEHNTFDQLGQIKGIGKRVYTYLYNYGFAISTRLDNDVIQYNTITDVGYLGIYAQGLNTMIKYNYIKGTNQVLDDGAGIYMYKGMTYADNTRTIGSEIMYNIVLDNYGNDDGDDKLYPAGYAIYLDGSCKGVTVSNNVIGGATHGFYSNGGGGLFFTDNVIYDVMYAVRGEVNVDTMRYSNNKFYTTNREGQALGTAYPNTANQRLIRLESGSTYALDSNIYRVPYSELGLFRLLPNGFEESFAGWQTVTGEEANSTFNGTNMVDGYGEKLIYNETLADKTFYLNNATNVSDAFSGNSITTSFTLSPFTGKILIGQNLDCILDYEDSTAPVITNFDLPTTSNSLLVPVTLAASGSATKFILTTTNTTPDLHDAAWVDISSTTFFVTELGSTTFYAWVRDEAGNISASASDITDVQGTEVIAGYDTIYASTSSSTVRRGMPVTMTEDGMIKSVSFYHDGGSGNYLVGVYADDGSGPSERLAISAETALGGSAAWHTADLLSPVYVQEGTKVWIAFTSSIGGSKFEAGTPYRAQAASGDYNDGLPDPFGTSNQLVNKVSVYCTYVK